MKTLKFSHLLRKKNGLLKINKKKFLYIFFGFFLIIILKE